MRREKGGLRVTGTSVCTCKGGGGVELLRLGLTRLRGQSIRARSTMLGPLSSPMAFLTDLLVRSVPFLFGFHSVYWKVYLI